MLGVFDHFVGVGLLVGNVVREHIGTPMLYYRTDAQHFSGG